MLNFFKWPEPAHLSMTLLVLLCIAAQSVCLVMNAYRRLQNETALQKLERILELWILITLFAFSLMHGDMLIRRQSTLFAPVEYHAYRTGLVLVLLAITLAAAILGKRARPLFSALPACVLLPAIETLSGRAYPCLVALALLFYLLRGGYLAALRYQTIQTGSSSFMVKNAIDSLNSALLFCETDGHILLVNQSMQQLMITLTGRVQRNGLEFYEMLSAQRLDAKGVYDAQGVICKSPDEAVWMVAKTLFTLGRKRYTQISATDITRQWDLIEALNVQNKLLHLKREELKETIANLHLLSRKKETQEVRTRAHDILGNRLSLLLSTLYSEQEINHDVLAASIDNLIEEMKKEKTNSTAQDELLSLQNNFRSIGVQIKLEGKLPSDAALGRVFAEIIYEAVTNAVRHGVAREVSVRIWAGENCDALEISDNGHAAREGVAEGRGIGGMRDRLAPYHGRLEINPFPCFTISLTVPKGDSDVQSAHCG